MSVFLLVSTLQAGCNSQESSKRVTQERIEAAVRAKLKDPDSARFSAARLVAGDMACVAVNAKNSFGGYVGSRDFLLRRLGDQWVTAEDVPEDLNCEDLARATQQELEKQRADEAAAKAFKEQRRAIEAMTETETDKRADMTRDELVAAGKTVYDRFCAACHKPNGVGAGPIKKLDGSPLLTKPDITPALRVIVFGAGNGTMPNGKWLSNTEIAAVATFASNSWSNKSGVLIQPAHVSVVRNSQSVPAK